jgi:hypothetical protein
MSSLSVVWRANYCHRVKDHVPRLCKEVQDVGDELARNTPGPVGAEEVSVKSGYSSQMALASARVTS